MRRILGLAATLLLSFTLLASDKKKDPEEIGNRDVGKGINFYSSRKKSGSARRWRRTWNGRRRSSTIRSSPNTSAA